MSTHFQGVHGKRFPTHLASIPEEDGSHSTFGSCLNYCFPPNADPHRMRHRPPAAPESQAPAYFIDHTGTDVSPISARGFTCSDLWFEASSSIPIVEDSSVGQNQRCFRCQQRNVAHSGSITPNGVPWSEVRADLRAIDHYGFGPPRTPASSESRAPIHSTDVQASSFGQNFHDCGAQRSIFDRITRSNDNIVTPDSVQLPQARNEEIFEGKMNLNNTPNQPKHETPHLPAFGNTHWFARRAPIRTVLVSPLRHNQPDPGSHSIDNEPFEGKTDSTDAEVQPERETTHLPAFGHIAPLKPDHLDVFKTTPALQMTSNTTNNTMNSTTTTRSYKPTTYYVGCVLVSSGFYEYYPRNLTIDFTQVALTAEKGKEPMTDFEEYQRRMDMVERKELEKKKAKPFKLDPDSFKGMSAHDWESLGGRERRYPWISDVYEMYEGPPTSREIIKECETQGKFLTVEQFHDEKYDYVKCWILNVEFPMKMMIVPSSCFPDKKPKVGAYYDAAFHLVFHKVGPFDKRKILRLKHGTLVVEDHLPQKRFLDKFVRSARSEGCWAKILRVHVYLVCNNNGYNMETANFRNVIFSRAQLLTFPSGAHSIEGHGWIEALPGVHGVNPEPKEGDVKLFYLTGMFTQTTLHWKDPNPNPKTLQTDTEALRFQEYAWFTKSQSRYEWQPRSLGSTFLAKTKKRVDSGPKIATAKGNLTKKERILLSIEILRRIEERKSAYDMLNPKIVSNLLRLVGDRELDKAERLCQVTMKICDVLANPGAYGYLAETEPETIIDLFEFIRMNVDFLPQKRDSVPGTVRSMMFPEDGDSDYEKWED